MPTVCSSTLRLYYLIFRRTHANTRPEADFPSSAAFDAINSAFSDDAERKDAVKKGGAIFAFTLKNANGAQESWHIDLKETGKVGKGTAPEGKKANGEIAPSQN